MAVKEFQYPGKIEIACSIDIGEVERKCLSGGIVN